MVGLFACSFLIPQTCSALPSDLAVLFYIILDFVSQVRNYMSSRTNLFLLHRPASVTSLVLVVPTSPARSPSSLSLSLMAVPVLVWRHLAAERASTGIMGRRPSGELVLGGEEEREEEEECECECEYEAEAEAAEVRS